MLISNNFCKNNNVEEYLQGMWILHVYSEVSNFAKIRASYFTQEKSLYF